MASHWRECSCGRQEPARLLEDGRLGLPAGWALRRAADGKRRQYVCRQCCDGWTITQDHLYDPGDGIRSAVGVVGPRSCRLSAAEIIAHPGRVRFRLRDDDGEVYYTGWLVGDGDPLRDYGQPNAGATEQQIRCGPPQSPRWV